jgi:hypothetical protein
MSLPDSKIGVHLFNQCFKLRVFQMDEDIELEEESLDVEPVVPAVSA